MVDLSKIAELRDRFKTMRNTRMDMGSFASDYGFVRHEDGNGCGTVGCIAGWAYMRAHKFDGVQYEADADGVMVRTDDYNHWIGMSNSYAAPWTRDHFDLTTAQSRWMFHAYWHGKYMASKHYDDLTYAQRMTYQAEHGDKPANILMGDIPMSDVVLYLDKVIETGNVCVYIYEDAFPNAHVARLVFIRACGELVGADA
jgi:hypothetical protein